MQAEDLAVGPAIAAAPGAIRWTADRYAIVVDDVFAQRVVRGAGYVDALVGLSPAVRGAIGNGSVYRIHDRLIGIVARNVNWILVPVTHVRKNSHEVDRVVF